MATIAITDEADEALEEWIDGQAHSPSKKSAVSRLILEEMGGGDDG